MSIIRSYVAFFAFCGLTLLTQTLYSQDKVVEFQGQLSGHGQYAPMDDHYTVFGARYIPQLNIYVPSNSEHKWDFEISADVSGYYSYMNSENIFKGEISPYRFWARYRYKGLELRLGLQKIDFGSSSLLRPLQWFNSMDPRDPLKITNGVFGFLGRYYFENNANLWLWCLTMNDDPRGMDIFVSDEFLPEFGGRFQFPVPRGELAFTYNHRWVDVPSGDASLPSSVQEDKFALDGKWDLGVGLWFETTYAFLHKEVWNFTHQFAFNLGLDYTFGLGNGLNASLEHMIMSYDQKAFAFENVKNITALQLNYPFAMFDTVSLMGYYNWEQKQVSAFLSYMHSFEKLTLYTNLYYNPILDDEKSIDIARNMAFGRQTDLIMGRGVGLQLMLVFNH